jgi:hypothetical protein
MLVACDTNKTKKFIGISELSQELKSSDKRLIYLKTFHGAKKYKKNIVNKWHVIIFLYKNPILLMYRKDNLIKNEKEKQDQSKLGKCLKVFKKCCKKESKQRSA